MADNKRYYYMRLKENFFDSDEIKVLESMTNGFVYSNILLKLYLRSLKGEGRLAFNGIVPYTPEMLSSIIGHPVQVIERALKVFEDLNLIEILDDGIIFMTDIQTLIGKTSTESDRIRQYRKRISDEKASSSHPDDKSCYTERYKCNDKCNVPVTPEIELEKKKELNSELNICGDKHHRTNSFVKPSVDEIAAYCKSRNNSINPEQFYDFYQANGWRVGRNPMRDWKASVRYWERNENKLRGSSKSKARIYSYEGSNDECL